MSEPWLSGDDCPEVERHASVPSGYVARAEDAERRLAAGEVQRQCPACGLWAIWDVPSAQTLSEATPEQLRAELARRDGQPTQPVVNEVGPPPPPSNEPGATLEPDWHAALTAAGLVRVGDSWVHLTSGVAAVWLGAGSWWTPEAVVLGSKPYVTEEAAARAWQAARGGGA